ncbi:hypothetical protein [Leptolyngbya ohadii]|uniref:hypothetical protein n=1 Tax=Leptolyngbya ohadii TaxID=1962290 RepID=UPI000B5A1D78|nr:hypothetical protein [Leptolyngbya ohadii]
MTEAELLRLEITELKHRVAKLEGKTTTPAVLTEREFMTQFGLGGIWESMISESHQRKISLQQVLIEKALLRNPDRLASAQAIDGGNRYLIEAYTDA